MNTAYIKLDSCAWNTKERVIWTHEDHISFDPAIYGQVEIIGKKQSIWLKRFKDDLIHVASNYLWVERFAPEHAKESFWYYLGTDPELGYWCLCIFVKT